MCLLIIRKINSDLILLNKIIILFLILFPEGSQFLYIV